MIPVSLLRSENCVLKNFSIDFLFRGLSEWAQTLRFLLDSLPSITGAHAVAHLAELGEHIFELKIHRFYFQIPSFYRYCTRKLFSNGISRVLLVLNHHVMRFASLSGPA